MSVTNVRVGRWPVQTVEERFWSKVDSSAGASRCWPWTRHRNAKGYGCFAPTPRTPKLAHRIAYELSVGPIPKGMHVRHSCDNPCCCNPSHLLVGTHADNMRDKADRGRAPRVSRVNSTRKLTMQQAREIRARAGLSTYSELGRAFGVEPNTARLIILGRIYREVLPPDGLATKGAHEAQASNVRRGKSAELAPQTNQGRVQPS